MHLYSPYTPDGAFQYLLLALGLTFVAAVAYLLVFTNASLPV